MAAKAVDIRLNLVKWYARSPEQSSLGLNLDPAINFLVFLRKAEASICVPYLGGNLSRGDSSASVL